LALQKQREAKMKQIQDVQLSKKKAMENNLKVKHELFMKNVSKIQAQQQSARDLEAEAEEQKRYAEETRQVSRERMKEWKSRERRKQVKRVVLQQKTYY